MLILFRVHGVFGQVQLALVASSLPRHKFGKTVATFLTLLETIQATRKREAIRTPLHAGLERAGQSFEARKS